MHNLLILVKKSNTFIELFAQPEMLSSILSSYLNSIYSSLSRSENHFLVL